MIFKDLYQDIRIKGQTVAKGNRECSSRYKALLPFLARYQRYEPFKVLDFGANYGYFSFRLGEDYPFSKITMVDYEPILELLYNINQPENIELIYKYMSEEDIRSFSRDREGEYDLVLAMSILHHFKNPDLVIEYLLKLGKCVIFEVGYPDETPVCNEERVKPIYDYLKGIGAMQINSWTPNSRPLLYVDRRERWLSGEVHSGSGLASNKTFPEVEYQIWDLFRTKFYPGTLNINLDYPVTFTNPTPFAEVYRIYPMYLNGFPCYNIRPNHIKYPTRNIEVISPYKLRDMFNLEDRDKVNVSFREEYISCEGVETNGL